MALTMTQPLTAPASRLSLSTILRPRLGVLARADPRVTQGRTFNEDAPDSSTPATGSSSTPNQLYADQVEQVCGMGPKPLVREIFGLSRAALH